MLGEGKRTELACITVSCTVHSKWIVNSVKLLGGRIKLFSSWWSAGLFVWFINMGHEIPLTVHLVSLLCHFRHLFKLLKGGLWIMECVERYSTWKQYICCPCIGVIIVMLQLTPDDISEPFYVFIFIPDCILLSISSFETRAMTYSIHFNLCVFVVVGVWVVV